MDKQQKKILTVFLIAIVSVAILAVIIKTVNEPKFKIVNISSGWVKGYIGYSANEGLMIRPKISFDLENVGSSDIEDLYLQFRFKDSSGKTTYEMKEWVKDIPAGEIKGPFLKECAMGYGYPLSGGNSLEWSVEILTGESYLSGPWEEFQVIKINSGIGVY